MTGEIHCTREVVDRLIGGTLSRDESQVLLEHLDSGPCARCDAADGTDDDAQFWMHMDHVARLHLQALRRRAKAGDQAAVSELHGLRFQALMRKLNEQRAKDAKSPLKRIIGMGGRLVNLVIGKNKKKQ